MQTIPDATSSIGKVNPFSKIALTFEPLESGATPVMTVWGYLVFNTMCTRELVSSPQSISSIRVDALLFFEMALDP